MIEALVRIRNLAKSWEDRREAPYWDIGDIAAAALVKVAQHGARPTNDGMVHADNESP